VLREPFWDDDTATCTERFYVVDAETGRVTRYALSTTACTLEQLAAMLAESGFRDVTSRPTLTGEDDESARHSFVIIARK
jgi:hypothetical protein